MVVALVICEPGPLGEPLFADLALVRLVAVVQIHVVLQQTNMYWLKWSRGIAVRPSFQPARFESREGLIVFGRNEVLFTNPSPRQSVS